MMLVVAPTFNPSTWKTEESSLFEFEASLSYSSELVLENIN